MAGNFAGCFSHNLSFFYSFFSRLLSFALSPTSPLKTLYLSSQFLTCFFHRLYSFIQPFHKYLLTTCYDPSHTAITSTKPQGEFWSSWSLKDRSLKTDNTQVINQIRQHVAEHHTNYQHKKTLFCQIWASDPLSSTKLLFHGLGGSIGEAVIIHYLCQSPTPGPQLPAILQKPSWNLGVPLSYVIFAFYTPIILYISHFYTSVIRPRCNPLSTSPELDM